MNDNAKIVHFALRVPLGTRVEGRTINLIEAHNEVVSKLGQVALAKFGSPGTAKRAKTLQQQIDDGINTLLVLVAKRGDRFLGYQSRLSSIIWGKPTATIKNATPSYYRYLDQTPELWFMVDTPFVQSDLTKFRLVSNHRPLLDVLGECRTSSMLIEQ